MYGNSNSKPFICHLCHRSFGRKYTLKRHIEMFHAEEGSMMDDSTIHDDEYTNDYEPVHKKPKSIVNSIEEGIADDSDVDHDSSVGDDSETDISEGEEEGEEEEDEKETSNDEEEEESSDLEDNVAYMDWLSEAKSATNDMWSEKYEKYVQTGMSEEDAREKAKVKTMWAVKRCFFHKYKNFLFSHLHLKDNVIHEELVADLEAKMAKGMNIDKAFSRVIPRHAHEFTVLFNQDDDTDEESGRESDA